MKAKNDSKKMWDSVETESHPLLHQYGCLASGLKPRVDFGEDVSNDGAEDQQNSNYDDSNQNKD